MNSLPFFGGRCRQEKNLTLPDWDQNYGETVNASHTVLTNAPDAASIYGGVIRDREARLHAVTTDFDDAKQ